MATAQTKPLARANTALHFAYSLRDDAASLTADFPAVANKVLEAVKMLLREARKAEEAEEAAEKAADKAKTPEKPADKVERKQ